MSQDVLESGVDRAPRRRRAAWLGVALLGVTGIWLAGRSNPEAAPAAPVAAPSPTLQLPRPPSGVPPTVVDAAVGDLAYVLLGRCPDFTALNCSQELLFSTGTGDWQPIGLTLPKAGHGFATRLLVDGGRVAVVDEDARAAYVVRGSSFDRRPVTVGRPVPGLSPGLVVDRDDTRVLAFDPVTAVRSPLATQPPIGELGDVTASGSIVAVVGRRDGATWLAYSRDGGRRWTSATVPLRKPPLFSRVVLGADDAVYVLSGRDERPDVKNEFSELWHWSDGRWTDVTPPRRPASAGSFVVSGPRLLLAEETGGLWELSPGGPMRRLPDPTWEGTDLSPTSLVAGPGGVLLAHARTFDDRGAVLSSTDIGRTWSVFVP